MEADKGETLIYLDQMDRSAEANFSKINEFGLITDSIKSVIASLARERKTYPFRKYQIAILQQIINSIAPELYTLSERYKKLKHLPLDQMVNEG